MHVNVYVLHSASHAQELVIFGKKAACTNRVGHMHFSFTCNSPEHPQMSDRVAVRSQTAKIKLNPEVNYRRPARHSAQEFPSEECDIWTSVHEDSWPARKTCSSS